MGIEEQWFFQGLKLPGEREDVNQVRGLHDVAALDRKKV